MNILKTDIQGLLIIEPKAFADDRGFFMETYNHARYREAGIEATFVQDNVSVSKRGTLRGLHFQAPPFAQGKLVQVLRGSVLDIAVDIRNGSPTYGKYVAVELSTDNKKQFWIPEGFAHGFVALEDNTIFSYKCTNVYSPEHDRGLLWSDGAIGAVGDADLQGIAWPLPVEELLISEKDMVQPRLSELAPEFVWQAS